MFDELSDTYRRMAQQDSSLWMWVTVDQRGGTSNTLMTQERVYNAMPEINPRFFPNFGVVELTLRQGSGTTVILKKVR